MILNVWAWSSYRCLLYIFQRSSSKFLFSARFEQNDVKFLRVWLFIGRCLVFVILTDFWNAFVIHTQIYIWAPHMKRTFLVCGNLCCFHLCFAFVENQITWILRVKTKYCENLLIFRVYLFFLCHFCKLYYFIQRTSVLYDDSSEYYVMYDCLSFIFLCLPLFSSFSIFLSLFFFRLLNRMLCVQWEIHVFVWYDFWYTKTIKINVPKHKLIGFGKGSQSLKILSRCDYVRVCVFICISLFRSLG